MSELVIARLVCNNIIIGKLTKKNIKDAYILNPTPKQLPNGHHALELSFMPFMFPISTDSVIIPLDKVILHIPAPKDLSAKYFEMTSNIIIPNNKTTQGILNHKLH